MDRLSYEEIFDFASEVYLHVSDHQLKIRAQKVMIGVEEIIGQYCSDSERKKFGLNLGKHPR